MKTLTSCSHLTALLALTASVLTPLRADLLVYESYDYSGVRTDGQSMTGVIATGFGLDGTYANNSGPVRYDTSGLTFSSNFFATNGGSANVFQPNGYGILGIGLDVPTVTGSLYQSFLYNPTTNNATAEVSGHFFRVSDSQTSSTNTRFTTAGEATVAGEAPGTGYNGSASSDMVGTGSTLTTGTTYLFISRFTNVGTSLTVGDPGVSDLWVFTSTGYDAWLADGALESELGTFALMTATDTVTSGTFAFADDDFLQLAGTTTGSAGGINVNYDELRFGTTLADVAISAVPEPATASLLLGAGLLLLRRRTRRG